MSRADLERTLRARARHFSPFLVLGDPTPKLFLELAGAAVAAGASMLELGLAFSDPCADGLEIQAADERVRRQGGGVPQALDLLKRLHAAHPHLPLNLLVYGNLVHARGSEHFCGEAAQAGASSLLVPDIPLEEAAPLMGACARAGLASVFLVGPRTPPARIQRMAQAGSGFLYLAAVQAITGTLAEGEAARRQAVARVAAHCSLPLCAGFGLKEPAHLIQVFEEGARIGVVGSALVALIRQHLSPEGPGLEALVPAFSTCCQGLARAAGATRTHPEERPSC